MKYFIPTSSRVTVLRICAPCLFRVNDSAQTLQHHRALFRYSYWLQDNSPILSRLSRTFFDKVCSPYPLPPPARHRSNFYDNVLLVQFALQSLDISRFLLSTANGLHRMPYHTPIGTFSKIPGIFSKASAMLPNPMSVVSRKNFQSSVHDENWFSTY